MGSEELLAIWRTVCCHDHALTPGQAMEEFAAGNPAVELVEEVDWMTVLLVCCIAIFLIVVIILTTLYVISYKQKQKKKYNFGVKKPKNTERTFLNFRKSSPVSKVVFLLLFLFVGDDV